MAKIVDSLRVLPAKMESYYGSFLLYNHHGATDDSTTGLIYEENNKYTNELVEKAKQKNWRVFTGFCMHSHPTEI